jgi:hypothetical protein
VREHADLRADPAFGIGVGGLEVAGVPEMFGCAEGAGRPENRDKLHDLTGHRVPYEMAGTALADQPLRGRLNGNRARRGAERQPDGARRTAA